MLPFTNAIGKQVVDFLLQSNATSSGEKRYVNVDKVFSAATMDVINNFLLGLSGTNVKQMIEKDGEESFFIKYFETAGEQLVLYILAPWLQHFPFLGKQRQFWSMHSKYFAQLQDMVNERRNQLKVPYYSNNPPARSRVSLFRRRCVTHRVLLFFCMQSGDKATNVVDHLIVNDEFTDDYIIHELAGMMCVFFGFLFSLGYRLIFDHV
jgi:hypothetical protein